MRDLHSHIEEIAETLAPEHGPESPSEAVKRLLDYYERLDHPDRYGFVAVLLYEMVVLRVRDRAQQLSGGAACG